MSQRALLALEDGAVFEGTAFGAPGERAGEVVFNTSMTGYQEVLTDPSYAGQIVTMTYPLIGNYGVNSEDIESHDRRVQVRGFVVKELSPTVSNFRSERPLDEYLRSFDRASGQHQTSPSQGRWLRLRPGAGDSRWSTRSRWF